MNVPPALICPKCGGEMRSYERNGVVVDQCTECRGIFLDRGELERLVDAEDRHYGEDRRRDDDRRREERPHKKSKKRSFLENLFEGD
jgi:Zn-finger nucleic acid-binding protein